MKTLSCNLVRKCGQAHLQPENVQRLLFNRHDSENKLALQLNNDGKPSFLAVYHSPVGIHSETSEANISTRV